jgi:hypothetical protein
MQINMAVEPLVREAFGAAVDQDIDGSIDAIKKMIDRGDAGVQDSVNLATAVATFALIDIHGGRRPSDEELRDLAGSFVEMESWARFDAETALTFLTALADQKSAEGLTPETVGRIVFVMGAWLLAAFGPDERSWSMYLDQILSTIEAGQSAS